MANKIQKGLLVHSETRPKFFVGVDAEWIVSFLKEWGMYTDFVVGAFNVFHAVTWKNKKSRKPVLIEE